MSLRHQVVFVAVLLLGSCAARDEVPSRLVLIGIDGGSWKLIDPLIEAGELKHLAALRDRGMTGELTAVEPLISPAVWTSIATGRNPEAHGISSFFAGRRDVRVPTLWERFAADGLKVGLYDYLITWPPRPLPEGFMVPGWLRRDDRVEPPDLFERLGLPPYFYEVMDVGDSDDAVANLELEMSEKPRYWNRLWEAFDLDAGAVVFYAVDVASHRFYHTAFPDEVYPDRESAPFEPGFADVLPRVLSGVDRAVGEIVAGLTADDHVVLVSDHGFTVSPDLAPRWAYDPAWLMGEAGVDPSGFDVINGFLAIGIEVAEGNDDDLARLEGLLETIRTADGRPVFNVAVVRPAEDGDRAKDLTPEMVDMMTARLPAHAFVFASGIAEVLDELWPDGVVVVGGEPHPLRAFAAPHVFTGDHDPVGIFLAAGPAIRHLPRRVKLSVLDVAPLLTYLVGRPLPDDLEGRLDPEWIEPDHLARHPVRHVAAAEVLRLPEEADGVTGTEDDEDVKRRLRALGYLD